MDFVVMAQVERALSIAPSSVTTCNQRADEQQRVRVRHVLRACVRVSGMHGERQHPRAVQRARERREGSR